MIKITPLFQNYIIVQMAENYKNIKTERHFSIKTNNLLQASKKGKNSI